MFLKNKLFLSIIFGLMFLPSLLFGQEGFRIEKDLLGEKQIPNDAYYGVQTLRALENFQISGVTTKDYPELVNAFVLVKLAGARANYVSGALPKYVLDASAGSLLAVIVASPKIIQFFLHSERSKSAGYALNCLANSLKAVLTASLPISEIIP